MSTNKRLLMIKNLGLEQHRERPKNVREIQDSDIEALGSVMLSAYRGTIDYTGESLEEATQEIRETLSGKYGKCLRSACLLALENDQPSSAVIFTWNDKEQMPLLTYSMTDAAFKGRGLAKLLIGIGLRNLERDGFAKCCLVVTDGNEPAISIY